jgi:hypothetical protein
MEKKIKKHEIIKYIIDEYNPYQKNENVVRQFSLRISGRLQPFCIRKIKIQEWDWGSPVLSWEEQDWDRNYREQTYYDTEEEALEFIRFQKRLSGDA